MRFPIAGTSGVAALALFLAGCDADPIVPEPPRLLEPVVLEEIGHGEIVSRYTGEVWVRNGVAYTSTWGRREETGNTFYVWDVTAPQPVLLDSVHVADAVTLGDIQASADGSLLAVAIEHYPTGGLALYSLSAPQSPTLVHRIEIGAGVHTAELARVAGRLYAFMSVNAIHSVHDARPARLVVADVTNPASPSIVLDQEMGIPFVHDVFVRDGYLFTALWDEGLGIWDIGAEGGSPAAPRRLGTVETVGGNVHNVWWVHDPVTGSRKYAVVGEEGPGSVGSGRSSGDVHVVDVSDMSTPVEVAFYSVDGAGTHNFSMDEARGVLYAAYYNGGIRALDLRGDPGSCAADERDTLGRCDLRLSGREVGIGLADSPTYVWGVQQVGDRLYVSDMHAGLRVLGLAPLYAALGR